MSVAARLKLGAALALGLSLAAAAAMAQEAGKAGGAWTDPPARAAAPTPAARQAGEAKPAEATAAALSAEATSAPAQAETREAKVRTATSTAEHRMRHTPRYARRALRSRVAARTRPAHRTLLVSSQYPTRERARRRMSMRQVYEAPKRQPLSAEYGLPAGLVENPAPFGARVVDDRIRAAQAAGYIVVRSRSVQFPDGRSLRTYQPFADED